LENHRSLDCSPRRITTPNYVIPALMITVFRRCVLGMTARGDAKTDYCPTDY